MMKTTPEKRVHHLQHKGFTLIELMIVLVIMGFVLALAGPRVAKSLGGLSLKTTARKVAGALRFARSKAVNTGRTYHVIFDLQKNRMIVVPVRKDPTLEFTEPDDNNTEQDSEEAESTDSDLNSGRSAGQQVIRIYELPDTIRFEKIVIADVDSSDEEDEIYQMSFFPNGTSQTVEIVLADLKDRRFIITVDFITGAVSIAEQNEEE